jgi:DNA processing protein
MENGLFASTTPFTPPTTEDDRLSWLRLIRSRKVGPATFHRLLAEHGRADAALEALPAMARSAGLHDYEPCPVGVAAAEMAAARKAGMRMICWGTADYPVELADLPDAPPVLWLRGDPSVLFAPMVALVGARNASSLGRRMAARLAQDLGAAGLTVVSGLARGIDAAAHEAALPTGTVAVLAGGADVVYPPENADLLARIAGAGAVLSEQPPGLEPQARHFPLRNRIISGLALGVVVVEAAEKSGSLITARNALDQGRDVMAVPGHPVDARAGGCNLLIRDGCTLVRSADDVLEALGPALTRAAQQRAGRSRPAPQQAMVPPSAARRLAEAARTYLARGGADPAPAPGAADTGPGTAAPRVQPDRTAQGALPPSPRVSAAPPTQAPHPAAMPDDRDRPRKPDRDPPASGPRTGEAAPQRLSDQALAALPPGPPPRPRDETRRLHAIILDRLGPAPLAEDQLIRDLALPAARVAPELLALELDGHIERRPGGLLTRTR